MLTKAEATLPNRLCRNGVDMQYIQYLSKSIGTGSTLNLGGGGTVVARRPHSGRRGGWGGGSSSESVPYLKRSEWP